MKKNSMDSVTIVVGLILIAIGLGFIKMISVQEGALRALPYLCIGLGCGVFGNGMGNLINRKVMKNSPEIAKQKEIESKDERNLMIANCAKAKAFDRMQFVFAALLLSFTLMGVEMIAVLLLVAVYLFVIGCRVYYQVKLEKEM